MQIPLINGIYTDHTADYRTSYPLNLVPVPKQNGIAEGYLKKAAGIRLLCDVGSGIDRGGVVYQGDCYRVIGESLYRIAADGQYRRLGTIAGDNQCEFTYGFDRLAIVGGGSLYYLKVDSLSRVDDSDLGDVVDVVWIDGYFVCTDGEYLIQTDLNDPTKIDPLKYGSSEADPDKIIGLLKIRNELVVFNRNTIEVFDNTGGAGFAFARISGAMLTKGLIGTAAKCHFAESFAFVGSGKNEPCSIYIGGNGACTKIATREIERVLSGYSDKDLVSIVLEAKEQDMHQHLYVHLPDKTFVYDFAASQIMQQPVWFEMSSVDGAYRAINHVWAYNRWIVGDRVDGRVGVIDSSLASQYGEPVQWRIDTTFVYNGGQAGQIKSVELVGLTGRTSDCPEPQVFLSWTKNGMLWSNERPQRQGMRGQYNHRLIWLRAVGLFRQIVGLRFRGYDDSLASFTAIEADIEAFGNGR